MKTKKSDQGGHVPRWVKKYGDLPIIKEIFKGTFWKRWAAKDKDLGWDVLRDYMRFLTAMFASSLECFYRHRFGVQAHGLIISIYTALFMMTLNTTEILPGAKIFAFWFMPLAPFRVDADDLPDLIFDDVHSTGMAIYAVIYLVLSLWHCIEIYMGRGNRHYTKRGESWLYEKVFKHNGFPEDFFVQGIVEPLLTALLAWGIWALGDHTFAIYLWFAATSLFIQEIMDKSKQQAQEAAIN